MRGEEKQQSGFTLLEVMVALLILGVLSLAAMSTVRGTIKLWTRGTRDMVYTSELWRAQFHMRDMLSMALPPDAGGKSIFSGNQDAVTWTAGTSAFTLQAGLYRYRIARNDDLDLILSWESLQGGTSGQTVLLRRGPSLSFSFKGTDTANFQNTWTAEDLPTAVKIALPDVADETTEWPEIFIPLVLSAPHNPDR